MKVKFSFIVMVLVIFLVSSFVGCTKNNPTNPDPTPTPTSTPTPHVVHIKVIGAYYVDGTGTLVSVTGASVNVIFDKFTGTWPNSEASVPESVPYTSGNLTINYGEKLYVSIDFNSVSAPSVAYVKFELWEDSDTTPKYSEDVYGTGLILNPASL
jgi:hypothetical protein